MVKRRRAAKQTKSASGLAPRVILLAGGAGSRMRSTLPKVLHRVGGRSLLESVLRTAENLSPSRIAVVLGPWHERVRPALAGHEVEVVVQNPPGGSGDAFRLGLAALSGEDGPVIALSGDVALIRPETLQGLLERLRSASLDLVFLSLRPPDPGDLPRVRRDRRGRVQRIVEAKDAGPEKSRSAEVVAGVYCFATAALPRVLERLRESPSSQKFELTDTVEVLVSAGGRVESVEAADWREAWGINSRRDLAAAEEVARRHALERALDAGATLIDPATTRIGPDVEIEPDVVLHPFVSLEGKTVLHEGCEVLSFTRICDSEVSASAVVGPHCEIEGARIGARARVGPFARLRPETVLEEDVRVGNFVETKKAVLHRGVKALHLSYLGDAEIGAAANIGAGVITCNYDGEKKNRTTIGPGSFIGSDSQLIAPVTVGEGAYVGAGATITEDVPPGALALSRAPQKNIEGWVARRKEKAARARDETVRTKTDGSRTSRR